MTGLAPDSIDRLKLLTRTYNALRLHWEWQGLDPSTLTVDVLRGMTDQELLAVKNFGRVSLADLRSAIDLHDMERTEGVAPPAAIKYSDSSRPRTVKQAAEELNLSPNTIRAWIAQRRIGFLRFGRAIRIPAGEIARVFEDGYVPAARR